MYVKKAFKLGISLTGDFIELIPSFFSFIKSGLLEVEICHMQIMISLPPF